MRERPRVEELSVYSRETRRWAGEETVTFESRQPHQVRDNAENFCSGGSGGHS